MLYSQNHHREAATLTTKCLDWLSKKIFCSQTALLKSGECGGHQVHWTQRHCVDSCYVTKYITHDGAGRSHCTIVNFGEVIDWYYRRKSVKIAVPTPLQQREMRLQDYSVQPRQRGDGCDFTDANCSVLVCLSWASTDFRRVDAPYIRKIIHLRKMERALFQIENLSDIISCLGRQSGDLSLCQQKNPETPS